MGVTLIGGIFVGFKVLASSGNFATTPLMLGLFFALLILIAAVVAYRLREHCKVEGPQENMANFFCHLRLACRGVYFDGCHLRNTRNSPWESYLCSP